MPPLCRIVKEFYTSFLLLCKKKKKKKKLGARRQFAPLRENHLSTNISDGRGRVGLSSMPTLDSLSVGV